MMPLKKKNQLYKMMNKSSIILFEHLVLICKDDCNTDPFIDT